MTMYCERMRMTREFAEALDKAWRTVWLHCIDKGHSLSNVVNCSVMRRGAGWHCGDCGEEFYEQVVLDGEGFRG